VEILKDPGEYGIRKLCPKAVSKLEEEILKSPTTENMLFTVLVDPESGDTQHISPETIMSYEFFVVSGKKIFETRISKNRDRDLLLKFKMSYKFGLFNLDLTISEAKRLGLLMQLSSENIEKLDTADKVGNYMYLVR